MGDQVAPVTTQGSREERIERLLDEALRGERERRQEQAGDDGVPRWWEPDHGALRQKIIDTLDALEAGDPNGRAVRPDTTTQNVFGMTLKLKQRHRPGADYRLTGIMLERRMKEATWNPDDDNDALSPGEKIAMDIVRAEVKVGEARAAALEASANLAAAENELTRAQAARETWISEGKIGDDSDG